MKIYMPNEEWGCFFLEKILFDKVNTTFRKEIKSPAQNYSPEQMDSFAKEAYANNFERSIKHYKTYVSIIDFFQNRLYFKTDDDYEDKVCRSF